MAAEPKPQDPKKEARDRAIIQIVSGVIVIGVGVGLYLWGSPVQPGQRRNALWLALEQAMGYNGTCMLFVGIGGLLLSYGVFRMMKAKKM